MLYGRAPPPTGGVDILFVVQNDSSMMDEQALIMELFQSFVASLEAAVGERPSLHIGVVSTDLGAGPYGLSRCEGDGDDGVLQGTANYTCAAPAGNFIIDTIKPDLSRETNYTGTLTETLGCIGRIGFQGCGVEQPLEALRRALDGRHEENAGLLRPDAALAVVFIAGGDDCSTEDVSVWDIADTSNDGELGPLPLRCFEFGVVCEPDEPRAEGPKSGCVPREDSEYMHGVQEYIDFLHTLKPANWIVVGGPMGDPSPVTVYMDYVEATGEEVLALNISCYSSQASATPAIRLHAFADSFAPRSATGTICQNDAAGLAGAIDAITAEIAAVLP